MESKNVQIPKELFFNLMKYFVLEIDDPEVYKKCVDGIQNKFDSMCKRELYSKFHNDNGTSGDVYICNHCGAEYGSSSELSDHCASFVGVDNGHARATYTIRDGQPIYENQWEITQEEYDETIVVGQICVNCGLTRE